MLRYLNYLNNSKYSQNLANLFHIVFFILDHLSIEHWMLALVKTCQNPEEEEVIRMHSACWSQWVRCSNSAAQDVVHFFPYRFVLRMLPEISPAQGKWHQVTSSDRAKLATWLVWNRTWVVWAYLHFPLDGRSARKVAANPRWIKSVFANWFEKGSTATLAVRLRDDLTLDCELLCNECARMHHFKNFRPMTCLETS